MPGDHLGAEAHDQQNRRIPWVAERLVGDGHLWGYLSTRHDPSLATTVAWMHLITCDA